ncbi:MAG TPA: response regulator [Nitrospira sp.]|nr:response regulator [Nitrospira sp.]
MDVLHSDTTLLLIDGDDYSRRYYADRLKLSSPGLVVLEAATGQSGLDVYRTHRIDCVVLELALPDMSGFEVLMQLIPFRSGPEVVVVVLTRLPSPDLSKIAKNHGAVASLVKSRTSGDDLHEVIQHAMAVIGPARRHSAQKREVHHG